MSRKEETVGYITSLSRPIKGCSGDTGEWRVFRPVKDDEKRRGRSNWPPIPRRPRQPC